MPGFDRFMFSISRPAFLSGIASLAVLSGSAQATWSILIADTRTGEIVIGSATCVESINLQHETPVLISGIGAVTAQSAVDSSGMNRQLIRDRLLQGVPLDALLDELAMTDGGHNNRQYGMITADGQTLTYSGIQNAAWAGGQTGRIERGAPGFADDIVYAVQGNILSGSNVVQAAVDAILASDGDLPAMMMSGMQAAKIAGGDGRCSCSNADPTGCGSPPPAPFKSAHVGYMLGTRADDIDAVRAIYPTDELIGAIATIDLDNDGFEEVVVGSASSNEILIYRNTAMPGDPLSTLELWQTIEAPASETVAIEVGRFFETGNENPQFAIAHANPPTLSLYVQSDNNGPSMHSTRDLPWAPTGLGVGGLTQTGNDLAVTFAQQQRVRFYGLDNTIVQTAELLLDYVPAGIEIGSFLADPRLDLALTDASSNTAYVYAHTGDLSFDTPVGVVTAAGPTELRGVDMDLDGDNEIVVLCDAGRRAEVYTLENDQWVLWGAVSTAGVGIAVELGDMSGDGFPDIVTTVAATNRNLQLFISDGLGGFTQQTRTRVGSGAKSVRLEDMNNNGDLDIVVGNGGSDGLMILDNTGDIDLPQPGRFAEGQYFMSFNIPNQRSGDPDPVDQLQVLYNDWLLTREGRVDAVRSSVVGRSRIFHGLGSTLTIELRDLHNELLDITDPSQLQLDIGDELVTFEAPVLIEPGVFEVGVNAGEQSGQTQLIVHAGEDGDRVRLMPGFTLTISDNIADFNADGVCNFFDVSLYLALYINDDLSADIDGDGVLNFMDISAFLSAFSACNP